ncbi:MAG: beta-N-acetylhexosaminidase [Rhodospirillales bacterium]|nr:beta-N-acetylhexosaminidase [Rhodospirillales bacterium]
MQTSGPRAVIFGVAGPSLSAAERRFFSETDPLGFILFARNCRDPREIRRLVSDLGDCVGRGDALVLIDQEGGRVQRLKPPHWRAAPPAEVFGRLSESDEQGAIEAAWLNARLLAADLASLGIDVDCAPVLDVRRPEGHAIIGDRAFAGQPETVALLGRATCAGLLAGGVLPVIKHIPGHGRACLDSHEALPVVHAAAEDLQRIDFAPFAALADMPLAMTAHVVFAALDAEAPATTSAVVIREAIRGAIAFDGLLISDDICMRALVGPPAERARAALEAGCDVVLHCDGDLAEMRAVAEACPPLSADARRRLARAQAMRAPPEPFEPERATERLAALLGGRVSA